jgi:cyclopropane fatty-acyl-phospholipid synthase-like methyltransferase
MDDMRDLVKRGYERCAKDYAATRDQFQNTRHLEDLARRLPDGARVLDLGCGSGRPVDAFLLERGLDVTGVDVSGEQIRLAREALPAGTFIQGDMSDVAFPAETFDAVVSFYAIFHIPREEHAGLLRRTWRVLRPGGCLLATMGSAEWEGTEEDFHGTRMFWSHYGREENLQLIGRAGFAVLSEEVDPSGGEEHLVVLAQKVTPVTPP